jgi:choline dehydrogenase-like flavoprotein
MKQVFDVCIVGSGPGGGIAAYALTRAGLTVALIEAGRRLQPGVDFNAHATAHHGTSNPANGVGPAERNHFTPVGDNPKHGLLKALGGRSLCWAGHSLRFGPLDFRRWPISYGEVAPYYSKAELFMGVYGNKDGLWNLPDGEYLKPVRMRCGEMLLHRGVQRLKTQSREMDFIALRKAILTQPHPSHRAPCHYCGHCMAGCEVDAKYTSANTPIPAAMRTGKLTLLTESTMTRISFDPAAQRVTGIVYRDSEGRENALSCRALVLACSALETSRHLLLNRPRTQEAGLGNGHGQVGRNIATHTCITVNGIFPELQSRNASNDDGTDYFHSLLTGLYWDNPNRDFDGTYQVQCGSGLHPRAMRIHDVPGYGIEFKKRYRELNAAHVGMNMEAPLLMSDRKFLDLDPVRTDRFGLALPRLHLHYESNEYAMAKDAIATCEAIIDAGGGTVHSKPERIDADMFTLDHNHWVGGARMGTDPRTSVVDVGGQVHGIRNLFLGDASVFTHYPEKNPTLTNIALSWRMSDRLAEKARKGELN